MLTLEPQMLGGAVFVVNRPNRLAHVEPFGV